MGVETGTLNNNNTSTIDNVSPIEPQGFNPDDDECFSMDEIAD